MTISISDLSDDLLEAIAVHVFPLYAFFSTCKRFNSISKSDNFWQLKLKTHFSREKPRKGMSFRQQYQKEYLFQLSDYYVTVGIVSCISDMPASSQSNSWTDYVRVSVENRMKSYFPFSEVEFTSKLGTTQNSMLFSGIYRYEKSIIKVMKSKKTNRNEILEKMSSIWQSRHFINVAGICTNPKIFIVQVLRFVVVELSGIL